MFKTIHHYVRNNVYEASCKMLMKIHNLYLNLHHVNDKASIKKLLHHLHDEMLQYS